MHRADDDHQSRECAYRCRDRASQWPAISIPASLRIPGSAEDRDNCAPGIGGRAIRQVWSFWIEQSSSTGER
jgi:hypothetical protein